MVIDNDLLEDIQVIEPEIRSSDQELYNVSEDLAILQSSFNLSKRLHLRSGG